LLERCALPVTARGVVKLIVTDLGVFVPAGDHFVARELAPGYTIEEVQEVTGARLVGAPSLHEVQLG
ncbi:MAG TPA: succinyl-CoA--3-ketoacid-CoA transferase, partial [Dehalococcoidia bacterium]|nr:succinyl-CoA--3-ketoacid-CoA transferase [Dehalococcoidia bacterium]